MNLKHLTDDKLLAETQILAQQEREILTSILHHLREIEKRRLFSTLKCSSLFDYTVKVLGYSEDQAYRRIQAMRLLKEMPEVEEKIQQGALSLTHLGLAQSFFRREEKQNNISFSKQDKTELLEKLQNTTKREAEKIVLSHSSTNTVKQEEKIRVISGQELELKIILTEDVINKLSHLKGLLAHKYPCITTAELISKLCDFGLSHFSPAPEQVESLDSEVLKSEKSESNVKEKRVIENTFPLHAGQTTQKQTQSIHQAQLANSEAQNNTKPKRISIRYKQVWQKAKGACQNCGSTYALEIDHIYPRSLGGEDSFENLRLLCRSCNQRAAIEKLGLSKMEKYLEA